jgi:hypothetical protein
MVVGFGFGRWNVANGSEQPPVVVPVDPAQGSQLQLVSAAPGTAMDDLGFVESVDRFGERIVVAVADASDEGSMPASARRSV